MHLIKIQNGKIRMFVKNVKEEAMCQGMLQTPWSKSQRHQFLQMHQKKEKRHQAQTFQKTKFYSSTCNSRTKLRIVKKVSFKY